MSPKFFSRLAKTLIIRAPRIVTLTSGQELKEAEKEGWTLLMQSNISKEKGRYEPGWFSDMNKAVAALHLLCCLLK